MTAACDASVDRCAASRLRRKLHERFLAICVACCAKPMRSFGALSLWFGRIGNRARPKVLQFIFFGLSIPCFHASNLFFKLAYAFGAHRLRLIRLGQARLGIKDELLERDLGLIDLDLRVGTVQALRNVQRRLEACIARADFGDHGVFVPSGCRGNG